MHRTMLFMDDLYTNFASCWRQASRKKKALIYVGVYTVVFLTAFLIAYSPFFLDDRTFVWAVDARTQHFPFLVYIGKALRRIMWSLWNGKLAVPLFDISIGMGDDVIGLLSSQQHADPLMLISAFVPTQYGEYLFDFLAIFRVYLAGLSFSFLCFYFKKRAIHILIGSVVYCFCGCAMLGSMRHPYFINPMISLPLLTVGIDKILKKEKPYLFIFTVFYTALCGFYYLYMTTIMLAIYAVVRFFDIYKENRFKEFILLVVRGTSGYLLGIGLAAIIFLPAIAEFLNSARVGFSNFSRTNSWITYSWEYYQGRFLRLMIAPPGGWSDPAFAAIALFSILLLYFSRGKRTLKIFMMTAFAIWLTSIGGLVMNGFQYPSNRWTFGFALTAAYVVVEMLPQLLNLSRKQQIVCTAALVIYTIVCFSTDGIRQFGYLPVAVIFLALTLLVLTMSLNETGELVKRREKGNGEKMFQGLREYLCLLLVIVNVGVNGIYTFATDQGNIAGQFQKSGYEINRLESAIERELEPYLLKAPKGRGDGTWFIRNTAMVWQIPGTLTYSSTANRNVTEFWRQIENWGLWMDFSIHSTDQRTAVNTLLSVKYQVEPEKKAGYVPYGYTQIEKTENGDFVYLIYENKYALPWGYTYDNVISYEQLDGLNGIAKQEAMLQAIALDEKAVSGIKRHDIKFNEKRLRYKIASKNCKWEDGILTVSEENATITLRFSMPKNVEGYVRLKGFDINDSGLDRLNFRVKCGGVAKTTFTASHLWPWYRGQKIYLTNLGYSERARKSLTITFPNKGKFKLEDIELYALPMDNYPARVKALRAEPLKNIKWGTNTLTGTVNLSKDKILCVSVPYSNGWSATVDGEKVKILRGNYMFMALSLKAGHHDIKFSYCTPGLKLGAVIFALSACIVAWMLVRDRRRRKAL